ncbi:class I SAM-dependent methyltransferase [Pseudonocardia abyssalis]|uniref:Class I SAM-dependent methyltransferase n=1 Tax=Pseudonocardia abyssalis TaxID=2792008 RepID=A0ABS6UY57_9PSEU|nr:class I SAM-dependent methyltransferase [Pseudonocardia abyssalis]MBW0115462.1 class I SAM-dependent methyltransferase [Pseudonocardia abyssalis]MBW0137191.1 class I SAM-dependent methyltransferase [Pseudonocardia abyssalis]
MSEGPAGWAVPLYEAVLDATGVREGTRVLDVGCGGGGFSRAAVARGAQVHGVDGDPSAVALAAREVPEATFAVGDAADLGDVGPVDVVGLVQLVAHLRDPRRALAEAVRVAPGGLVAVTVWGREQDCEVRAFGEALAPWLGPRRPPPEDGPDQLADLVGGAGLRVVSSEQVVCAFRYPDEDAVVGPLFDSGIGRHAMNAAGPATVRAAVLDRLERHRDGDGYVLNNTFRVLVARP